jgi:hypothetical protein
MAMWAPACAQAAASPPPSPDDYQAYLDAELRDLEVIFFWWNGLLQEWGRVPDTQGKWREHVDRPLVAMRDRALTYAAPACYAAVHDLWKDALREYTQASAFLLSGDAFAFMRHALDGHDAYYRMGIRYSAIKRDGCPKQ